MAARVDRPSGEVGIGWLVDWLVILLKNGRPASVYVVNGSFLHFQLYFGTFYFFTSAELNAVQNFLLLSIRLSWTTWVKCSFVMMFSMWAIFFNGLTARVLTCWCYFAALQVLFSAWILLCSHPQHPPVSIVPVGAVHFFPCSNILSNMLTRIDKIHSFDTKMNVFFLLSLIILCYVRENHTLTVGKLIQNPWFLK